MKNEELERLLRLSSASGLVKDGPDALVAFEDKTLEPDDLEISRRLRLRFVSAVFHARHPELIKSVSNKISFGIWVGSERNTVKLDVSELANALACTPEQILNIEQSKVRPWDLGVEFSIRLMHLMRLHFEGLAALTRNAAAASQMIGINSVQARCHSGKMTSSRGDAVSKAIEMFKANNADPVRDDQAEDWLRSVRSSLLSSHDELIS